MAAFATAPALPAQPRPPPSRSHGSKPRVCVLAPPSAAAGDWIAARGRGRASPKRAFSGQAAALAGARCSGFLSFTCPRSLRGPRPPYGLRGGSQWKAPAPAVVDARAYGLDVNALPGEVKNLDNIGRHHSGVWHGRSVRYRPESGEVAKTFDLTREIVLQGPPDTALSPYSTFFASHFERRRFSEGGWKSAQWAHIVDMPGGTAHDEGRDPPAPFPLPHRRTPLFLPSGAGAWVSHPFSGAELLLATETASGRRVRVGGVVSYDSSGALERVSFVREDADAWPSPVFPGAAPTPSEEPPAFIAPGGASHGFVWPASAEIRNAEMGTAKLRFSTTTADVFLQDYAAYTGRPHTEYCLPGGVRLYAPTAISPRNPDQEEGRGDPFAMTLVVPALEGSSATIVQARFGGRGELQAVVAAKAGLDALGM
eukprot:tig00021178_g19207.t1